MKRSRVGYFAFLFPCLLTFCMTVLIPTISGFYYSFTNRDGIGNGANFTGLKNYVELFTDDPSFWNTFGYTLLFAIMTVALVNLFGFLLALLVTQKIRGQNVFRAIFFMPNLIGGVFVGFSWQFIYTQVFNFLGQKYSLPFLQDWLSDTKTGTIGLLIIVVWQMAGFMMLIYIAQLQNISDDVLEAAEIDGATSWGKLTKIILPLMRPAFVSGLFLTLSSSFKLFDQNLTLTGGSPSGTTELLALNIYKTAFSQNMLGYAQAKAAIFLIIAATIGLLQLYFGKKKEVEM